MSVLCQAQGRAYASVLTSKGRQGCKGGVARRQSFTAHSFPSPNIPTRHFLTGGCAQAHVSCVESGVSPWLSTFLYHSFYVENTNCANEFSKIRPTSRWGLVLQNSLCMLSVAHEKPHDSFLSLIPGHPSSTH